MPITLDLSAELAAQLTSEASRHGLALDQYLLQAALQHIGQPAEGMANFDPHLAAAAMRNKVTTGEFGRLHLTDKHGTRIRTGLPEDMREGGRPRDSVG